MPLISISGIDGSGKTSVAEGISKYLNTAGIAAYYSRPKYRACKQTEHYFERIHGDPLYFYGKPSAGFYFNMIISDWLCHFADIIDAHRDKVIILDRYVYDVFAQGMHMGVDSRNFQWVAGSLPAADLAIYLNVPPDEALRRIIERDSKITRSCEELEELTKLKTIYEDFLKDGWNPVVASNADLNTTIHDLSKMIVEKFLLAPGDTESSLKPAGLKVCDCCGLFQYK